MRRGGVFHPFAPVQCRLKSAPQLFQPVVPRPSHRDTPASSTSRRLRRLSRPRYATPVLAVCCCGVRPLRAGAAARTASEQRPPARRARRAVAAAGRKVPFELPSMLPLLSSPLAYFFSPAILWALCHMAPIGLAASCGVGTSRLQRPSIRAGANTRHPILSASFDESRKACGRRPHLSDGFFAGPGSSTGRLHQHQGRSLTQHRNTAYASLSDGPLW